jgi:hypothetical protein
MKVANALAYHVLELIGKKLVWYLFAKEAKGGASLRHNGNYYYSKCLFSICEQG